MTIAVDWDVKNQTNKKTTVKPRLFEVPGTAGILLNNRYFE